MAHYRTVLWNTAKPTRAELEMTLRCFLGPGFKVYWSTDSERHLFAELGGEPGHPFAWDASVQSMVPRYQPRVIEVVVGDAHAAGDGAALHVVTRLADEFTGALANGFLECCRRRWNGSITAR